MSFHRRPSKNSTRTSEQEVSLLDFASSARRPLTNSAASLVRIGFCSERFDINNDILV